MDEISDTVIAYIENWCNTLPRKILGYQSTNDAYAKALNTLD